jgi:ribose/xylose/arabinose/galactoside ABC-type transport system permease subunit
VTSARSAPPSPPTPSSPCGHTPRRHSLKTPVSAHIHGIQATNTQVRALRQSRAAASDKSQDGTLLQPIASVFLGGTSVFGGTGSITGTFVGSFIIGSINAGVISAGIQGFYSQLFFGLVIILSLVLQTLISRRMRH